MLVTVNAHAALDLMGREVDREVFPPEEPIWTLDQFEDRYGPSPSYTVLRYGPVLSLEAKDGFWRRDGLPFGNCLRCDELRVLDEASGYCAPCLWGPVPGAGYAPPDAPGPSAEDRPA